jgi:hypothetical protein
MCKEVLVLYNTGAAYEIELQVVQVVLCLDVSLVES